MWFLFSMRKDFAVAPVLVKLETAARSIVDKLNISCYSVVAFKVVHSHSMDLFPSLKPPC